MGFRRNAEIVSAIPLDRITRPQLVHAEKAAENREVIRGPEQALKVTLDDLMAEIARRNRGRGRGRIR